MAAPPNVEVAVPPSSPSTPIKKSPMKKEGQIKITVCGKEYPCRQTMGAMLRFKRETGREVTDMTGGVSDLCTYLYCCVVSACMADGVECGMGLDEFADNLSPADLQAWAEALADEGDGEGEAPGSEKKA